MAWPSGGPWMVVSTSTNVSWDVAVAALAAASTSRVAVVRIVGSGTVRGAPPAFLQGNVSVYAELRTGGTDPERIDDLVALTQSLARTHGLVLVGADLGLVVPLGPRGFTLADLASTLQAPVVLVTDSGPDAAHHTTLALETLAGRGLTAALIVVDDASGSDGLDPGGLDLDVLPIAPAGRVPAGVADQPERFPVEAVTWLSPMLHATRGRAAIKPQTAAPATVTDAAVAAEAAGEPGDRAAHDRVVAARDVASRTSSRPPRLTVSGKRIVLGLLGIFVVLVLVMCAVGMYGSGDSTTTSSYGLLEPHVERWNDLGPEPEEPKFDEPGPQPVSDYCPQYEGTIVPTRPSKAVVTRVNAAWRRIETWLAKNAPATRAELREPASLAKIDALQKRMSVRFPPELVASLLRHDGNTGTVASFDFAPFYAPLPVEEIFDEWDTNCTVLAEGLAGDDWWDPQFVPFATAGDGGNLLVDQRPGGHGRVGEFYPEDDTTFAGWPASVTALLEGTATSLESGKPYAGHPPRVVKKALTWGTD
jgi:cell wall assembly regulator SMI1